MSRDRVGIMGGTFDPIHHGHLVAAEEARWQFGLDRVLFVPTGRPWQKPVGVSSAEDRYLMTAIATAANSAFLVSRLELDTPGPTYTVDTLRRLRAALGERTSLFFITGADAVLQLLTWKAQDQVLALAEFIAKLHAAGVALRLYGTEPWDGVHPGGLGPAASRYRPRVSM